MKRYENLCLTTLLKVNRSNENVNKLEAELEESECENSQCVIRLDYLSFLNSLTI